MVYNNQQSQPPPMNAGGSGGNQQNAGNQMSFYDYQNMREKRRKTPASPGQQNYQQQPQQPQQNTYQPGSVARPDGRPTPDSGQISARNSTGTIPGTGYAEGPKDTSPLPYQIDPRQVENQQYMKAMAGRNSAEYQQNARSTGDTLQAHGTLNDVGAGFGKVNPMPPAPVQPAQPPSPPPVDRNAIVQNLMKGSGMNEADATAWAERNGYFNPQQQAAQRSAAVGQTTGQVPGQPGTGGSGSSQYAGMEFFKDINPYQAEQVDVNLPGMYDKYSGYNFGNQPFSQYGFDPNRISQFQGPDQQNIQGKSNKLMEWMLDNPLSMSDQNVAALKDKQKEAALSMQRQLGSQNAEEMARSGRFGGGGYLAQNAAIQGQLARDVLSGNREVDLQKMKQDFADRKSVAELSDTMMTGQMGRATDSYRAGLEGQTERERGFREAATSAQDAERMGLDRSKYQADEGFRGYESGRDQYQDALSGIDTQLRAQGMNTAERQFAYGSRFETAKALAGLAEGGATRDLQKYLAEQGFDIDRSKISSNENIARMGDATNRYGIDTTARTNLLDMATRNNQFFANLGQQAQQFGDTMNFNTRGQENDFFRWLMGQGQV